MKKVRFLKNHINGIKQGQVGDFSTGRADYLVRMEVAEYVTDSEVDISEDAAPEVAPVIDTAPEKEDSKQSKGKGKSAKVDEPCKTC